MRGIIILEGADGVGKTTLAKALVEKHGARYIHLGVHKDIWRWHLAAVRRAVTLAETELVVVDRLWLSEQTYGQTYRDGPAYDLGARCLDRVLQRYGAVNVLCVRGDLPRHLAHFEQLKTERPEKFDGVQGVARLYADLARGLSVQVGDTYLDQLIRYGDFAQRPDVMLYDMDQHEVDGAVKRIIGRLRGLMAFLPETEMRRADRPNLVGGIQRPKYLFVGEEISPQLIDGAMPAWPFVWSDQLSAATWLNQALHELRFDETTALWTNAISPDDWITETLEAFPQLKVIALGNVAREHLDGRGVECVTLPHPQWHRRFQHRSKPGYAALLKQAMREADQ